MNNRTALWRKVLVLFDQSCFVLVQGKLDGRFDLVRKIGVTYNIVDRCFKKICNILQGLNIRRCYIIFILIDRLLADV